MGSANVAVPWGSWWAGSAGIGWRLVEPSVAGAWNTIEEGIGWTARQNCVDGYTLSILELEARFADASDTVVVGVGRASGKSDALSSDVLGSWDADAGLEGRVVPLILIADRLEVGDSAVSVHISSVADIAFAWDSIETLVGSTRSASTVDPEKARVTVALTILKVTIHTAILIAGALSTDNWESSIADAAVCWSVKMTIERADVGGYTSVVVKSNSIVALAFAVDVGLVTGANGVAEASFFDEARFA